MHLNMHLFQEYRRSESGCVVCGCGARFDARMSRLSWRRQISGLFGELNRLVQYDIFSAVHPSIQSLKAQLAKVRAIRKLEIVSGLITFFAGNGNGTFKVDVHLMSTWLLFAALTKFPHSHLITSVTEIITPLEGNLASTESALKYPLAHPIRSDC